MRKNARLPKVLGKKLQKRRVEIGLTQEDLAYKVGLSRAYVGYIEQGRSLPALDTLQRIAKALKIDIRDLL